jgi:hypothetical protein
MLNIYCFNCKVIEYPLLIKPLGGWDMKGFPPSFIQFVLSVWIINFSFLFWVLHIKMDSIIADYRKTEKT